MSRLRKRAGTKCAWLSPMRAEFRRGKHGRSVCLAPATVRFCRCCVSNSRIVVLVALRHETLHAGTVLI